MANPKFSNFKSQGLSRVSSFRTFLPSFVQVCLATKSDTMKALQAQVISCSFVTVKSRYQMPRRQLIRGWNIKTSIYKTALKLIPHCRSVDSWQFGSVRRQLVADQYQVVILSGIQLIADDRSNYNVWRKRQYKA